MACVPCWRLRFEDSALFLYGFAKNQRTNISEKELKALKLLAENLLGYGEGALKTAVQAGDLYEVENDE